MAGTEHRPHQSHKAGDKCPVCGRLWEEWPMAHRADIVCGQKCEKSEAGQRLLAYELNREDITPPTVESTKPVADLI